MTDLTKLTAAELAQRLSAGETTSVEATQAHLDRITAVDGAVHAYLTVDAEGALQQAEAADAARAADDAVAPLAGVPIAVKDNLVTRGLETTAGSRMLEGWKPPYDAHVIERLRAAGMPILGKTNMDEFAMGSSTETSGFGATNNPWGLDRIPGGSGGGSAAAVAAFEAPIALGTDTGGSVRQPASVTGTVGVKPTYGGVSRYGAIAMASSLDQIGPAARTVLDAALLHDVIGGHDVRDQTSMTHDWPSFAAAAKAGLEPDAVAGLRVGVPRQLAEGEGFEAGVRERFQEALDVLTARGATITWIDLDTLDYAVAAYYLLMPAEVSSNLARYDSVRYGLRVTPEGANVEQVMSATRAAGFGDEAKRRILLGTYALSSGYYDAYYGSAQKVRTLVQGDFDRAFGEVDVLVAPTSPTVAWKLGERLDDPTAMYVADITTIPANLAGIPALSLPMGLSEGLPVGFQFMAPAREDARLYKVGAALEAALNEQWGSPLYAQAPELKEA
ncbi:Asp-tRNA(Asn)/Glu-tRNA(Gln) amidotransferase subunit GatA [Gulosibacter sediminis]|uniref:Asp-tRNA(Asn)/Glu-tRNA(Gln) amidotransferase subunit GatA n=1 Tax=Gulosibacter sediminis TaxID=1729695 RepID=UPI0024A9EB4B|nr:Asp-tRNA(Asn)/Glu-tRNA(Gln) amidotransferase subunit GatA [Gulosibacter sediminis]